MTLCPECHAHGVHQPSCSRAEHPTRDDQDVVLPSDEPDPAVAAMVDALARDEVAELFDSLRAVPLVESVPTPLDEPAMVPVHCSDCGDLISYCSPPAPSCRVVCADCKRVAQ